MTLLLTIAVIFAVSACTPKADKSSKTAEEGKSEQQQTNRQNDAKTEQNKAQNDKKADAQKEEAQKADVKPASADTAKADNSLNPKLLKPETLKEQAPEKFKVKLKTSKGDIIISVDRSWAPLGADRFYNLVINDFFKNIAIFRVVDGFVAQFGIHGKPLVSSAWREANIKDDPVKQSNKRGTIVFATAGPNTRTTQFFINYKDNTPLDQMGFAPFGVVEQGMDIVDNFFKGYGERPNQGLIQMKGNEYLKAEFPKLDYVLGAEIVK